MVPTHREGGTHREVVDREIGEEQRASLRLEFLVDLVDVIGEEHHRIAVPAEPTVALPFFFSDFLAPWVQKSSESFP